MSGPGEKRFGRQIGIRLELWRIVSVGQNLVGVLWLCIGFRNVMIKEELYVSLQ